MLLREDLPADVREWDSIFLAAMGSPDPTGRQLNGMGGGVSSLSKVCVIGSPTRTDADVDFTFAQVMVSEAQVDYSITCGNMAAAVGPFALARGLVEAPAGAEALVRIHNTNTRKIIHSRFAVEEGLAAERGDLAIPGVAGSGAPIRLEFIDPGGASTGALLPGNAPVQALAVPDLGPVEVSLIDAGNACVYVAASSLGLRGTEMPDEIEGNAGLLGRLADIRAAGSVAMGLARDLQEAHRRRASPFVAFVAPPQEARTLSGERVAAGDADVTLRAISSGQPHRALPLSIALCTAVAARIPDTLVRRMIPSSVSHDAPLRMATPSGVLVADARFSGQHADRGSFFRTARRLFDGYVHY